MVKLYYFSTVIFKEGFDWPPFFSNQHMAVQSSRVIIIILLSFHACIDQIKKN